MSLNSKILIASFYFPPYNKVGGRRWAKHAKWLCYFNVDVNVVCGLFAGNSPWDKDVESYKSKVTKLNLPEKKIAYHLKKLPKNIFQKIIWKLSYWFWEVKKKSLQGNYNDLSIGTEIFFHTAIKKILSSKKIDYLILSVGPFKYSEILPKIKNEFKEVKIILDYRDYWEDGFVGLTQNQIDYEKKNQTEVLKSVDLVLCPNNEMKTYYTETMKKNTYLLPHCFDKDDFKNIVSKKEHTKNNAIKIIYGGAFYHDISENLKLIRRFIDRLNDEIKVEADFFVSLKGYETELTHHSIKRHDFIDSESYFQKVLDSDFVILILPSDRVNAMSSKFYELIAMQKPILYFGGKGDVSKFLIENKLGFHITENQFDFNIQQIIENIKTNKIPDKNFNTTSFTFEYQTKLFLSELNNLCKTTN